MTAVHLPHPPSHSTTLASTAIYFDFCEKQWIMNPALFRVSTHAYAMLQAKRVLY